MMTRSPASLDRRRDRLRLRRATALLAVLVLLVGALPQSVGAASRPKAARVDAAVSKHMPADPNALVPVIVHRRDRTAGANAIARLGGRAREELKIGNGLAAEVPASKIAALAGDPSIARISYDAPMRQQGSTSTTLASWQLGAKLATAYPRAVRATEIWNRPGNPRGKGIAVAVLDSGIGAHNDQFGDTWKTNRLRAQVSFDTSTGAKSVYDDNGHGTLVAGIISGSGRGDYKSTVDDGKYMGIAPSVDLVSVKVSDRNGVARTSQVIKAIEWVTENAALYNIKVLNLSLVSTVAESYHTSLLDAAVEMAWLKGIVVVVSAGNGGPNTMLYPPANDPYVIVVGAMDDNATASIADDTLPFFSSYGTTQDGYSKPDVVAPGRRLYSTLADRTAVLAQQYPDRVTSDGLYMRMSGTSMSAPIVSGLAALLAETRPGLKPGQVKWLLTNTARRLATPGTGAGYVDGYAAVTYAGAIGNSDVGLTPSENLKRAACSANPAACPNGSWSDTSWDDTSWDDTSWDDTSWDDTSWDDTSWDRAAGD
jgi:serine protease AprX